MLEREKQHEQETGKFLSKYDLTALFKGRGGIYVPASTRDVNAAQNILKAGAPPSRTVADGLPVEPRSPIL
jgi:hypothetical protein